MTTKLILHGVAEGIFRTEEKVKQTKDPQGKANNTRIVERGMWNHHKTTKEKPQE